LRNFVGFVWKQHRVIGLLTFTALCFALYFVADYAGEAIHYANPANQNRPVEPWMSIRYVEQSWGLNKPIMFEIIGYDVETPPDDVPQSVAAYLAESGQTLSDFQAHVEDAQHMLREHGGGR